MDEMKKVIGDVLEAMDGLDFDDVADTVIEAIGLEVDPNIGPNNSMVRYQTKWFNR